MKFNKIKSAFLLALMTVLLAPMAWANGSGYARLNANVSAASAGRGLVYADTTNTEKTGSYSGSQVTTMSDRGDGGTVTLYAFAYPTFGNKFTRWSTANTTQSDSGNGPTTPRATFSGLARASAPNQGEAYSDYYAYARFEDVSSQIKDIYLCEGDSVKLSFYNGNNVYWTSRASNETSGTFLTGNTATTSGQTVNSFKHVVSDGNNTNAQTYSVTVTAATESAGKTDLLTIMDSDGNVYHCRIHALAARTLSAGSTVDHTCNSFKINPWTASSATAELTTIPLFQRLIMIFLRGRKRRFRTISTAKYLRL